MIDWFTVTAQIVNFVILVAALKYFLYDRIVAAMGKREEEIATRFRDAQRQREEAAEELVAARQTHQQIDETREQLMADARNEVDRYRHELMAKARNEVDQIRSRWTDAIQAETSSFLRDLQRRTAAEVCQIARAALADLASETLERQMVHRFSAKLKSLDDVQRQDVVSSLGEDHRVAVVQTSFPLEKDLQKLIVDALQERLLDDLEVQFEQAADLICGIVLQTSSHKLAWDIRDYLAEMEQTVRHALEDEIAASNGSGRDGNQGDRAENRSAATAQPPG